MSKMTLEWIIFYGHKMGMSRKEILHTQQGQMLDILSCSGIYNGSLQEKEKKLTYDEIMALR